MKIFVTSDIHGRIDVFHKIVSFLKERNDIECLVLCGDIAGEHPERTIKEYGKKQYEEYRKMKLLLQYINKDLLFVLGNNDFFELEKNDKAYILYCDKEKYKNFIGIEYSNFLFENPKDYENEDSIKNRLDKLPIDKNSIVISHVPPYQCLDNIKNGMNFGSVALRDLIEKKKPLIFLCGHVHYAYGVEKLNDTLVFNVACDETTTRGWVIDSETLSYEKVELFT